MELAAFDELKAKLWAFMHAHIYPNEREFAAQCREMARRSDEWTCPPLMLELQRKARQLGLWNLFLPVDSAAAAGVKGGGLTNRQYAEVCEILGTSSHAEFAAQATNCTSPDTGNMETLARYGSPEQRERWLLPLLEGRIRSCFAMTEPAVASSDATNIGISIERDSAAGEYVINGSKWWITGAGSLHCKIMILMGKTDAKAPLHRQQSQILVPMDTPGITLLRPLKAFGDDDAPKGHMEIQFDNVRVPFENVLLGEGRGFEISQGRLGPGRIHHCMRIIGQAERSLALMCKRISERRAFGKRLSEFDTILQDVANSRIELEACRLLIFRAAEMMDSHGNADARTRQYLAMVKAHVPRTCQTLVDRCIQAHGALGVSEDTPLFAAFAGARALRIADGPDEVHLLTTAKIELKIQKHSPLASLGYYQADRTQVFRRSTDPISEEAQQRLDAASKL
ncbi:hypothetical protein AB1Y20_006556 [Prymnesium parvum]|uniref:Acyl-CoA dehydrogenase n=1 Tax=Prymnesium parvum TaxID=97485 RepID=A0AB34IYR9_PRYPA